MRVKLWVFLITAVLTGLASRSLCAQTLSGLLKKADSLRQLGRIAAEDMFREALSRSLSENKRDTTGYIYLRLGVVFERRSLYDKALENYFESLKIFERIHADSAVAAVKKNIGNVYRMLNDLDHAFFYINSSYLEARRLKDSAHIFSALNDLGLVRMNQGRLDEALSYFNSVYSSSDRYTGRPVKGSAISNMASIYWLKKSHAKALTYYQQAYEIRKEAGDKYKMALTLLNIGGLNSEMRQYKQALNALQQGVKLANEIKAKDLLQRGYETYSDIYKIMGDYPKAHASVIKSMAWKDSIYSEVSNEFKFSESNYRREKEEIKNKLLTEESNRKNYEIRDKERQLRQRNWLLLAITVVAALTILSLLLFYKAFRTRQYNERMADRQRSIVLEAQLKESELTALRAQMNPHFIFNALSSIKNYMLERNIQLADYYLGKFAKLIRLILDNSSQHFVSLEKELQLLESYIQLEQLRFENKFSYSISIQEAVSTMETFIPSMIIQPFVENAIIHGFMHKEGRCRLDIDISYHQTFLTVTIKDDGIGRLHSAQIKSNSGNTLHESKGYKISEERLKVLSQRNNTKTGIVYKDLEDGAGNTGTLVEISIPVEETPSIPANKTT